MTVLGGVIGALAAMGVLLLVWRWVGDDRSVGAPGVWSWLAAAGSAMAVGWLFSGWPALGVGSIGGVIVVRSAAAARARRRHHDAVTEALAMWAELLADVIRSHSALGQALQDTVRSVPPVLRDAVEDLAAGAQRRSMEEALAQFAADVDHGTADVIVAALGMADRGRAHDLPAVLDAVARQVRSRADMLLRVEAGRARIYAEARGMVGVTLAMAVLSLVAGRRYLDPYDGLVGQAVLLVVCGLFVAAGLTLVALGRPVALPRTVRRMEPSR